MAELYYYIPESKLDYAKNCGIKRSEQYDRELSQNGVVRKFLTAFLNPKDDPKKYYDANFRCLKLEVLPKYCLVGDELLFLMGERQPEAMSRYSKSLVPVEDYVFGRYRLPVCLVGTSVICDDISLLDKRIDSPVLYSSSEELYLNNLLESGRELNEDYTDTLLYLYYSELCRAGLMDKIEDRVSGMGLFMSREDAKTYTLKLPHSKGIV